MSIEAINSINTNLAASSTARILVESGLGLQKSLLRASSGLRLNSPEVDPAALAQFMQFDAQISRLGAVDVNVNNAVSFSQTQDGFLQGAEAALNRMGELSIAAQDPTKNPQDLAAIQQEFSQLQDFVGDVAGKDFNGVPLFSGNDVSVVSDSQGGTTTLNGIDVAASGADGGLGGVMSGVSLSTPSAAATASAAINDALQNLASMRATVGANLQNLNVTGEGNSILKENLAAASSRIADSDMAGESTQLARFKLLVQSATNNLSRANALPNSTLKLLA